MATKSQWQRGLSAIKRPLRAPKRLIKSLGRRVHRLTARFEPTPPPILGGNGYEPQELSIFEAFRSSAPRAEPGVVVDFLGVRTRVDYHPDHPPLSGQVLNGPIEDGKAFFNGDTAEWIGLLKCVLSASGRFVAMELGAGWGPWLVAGARAALSRGITDLRLYGVEPDPNRIDFMRRHFLDNDLDPDQHVLLQAAVGTERGTVRWPKTNPVLDWAVRPLQDADGESSAQGLDYKGSVYQEFLEVELIPLAELIAREPLWELVHIDVQGWEFEICRSATDIINERVQWIIVGTHSRKVEGDLIDHLFHQGWVLENEKPNRFVFRTDTPTLEGMVVIDGTQVWRNPRLVS